MAIMCDKFQVIWYNRGKDIGLTFHIGASAKSWNLQLKKFARKLQS